MDARSLAMPVDPAALAVTANAARISPRVWRVVAPNPSANVRLRSSLHARHSIDAAREMKSRSCE